MKRFKNKASKNGYIFGQVCSVIGVLTILISIFTIENNSSEHPINIYGFMATLIGFLLYKYGEYRTGGY